MDKHIPSKLVVRSPLYKKKDLQNNATHGKAKKTGSEKIYMYPYLKL